MEDKANEIMESLKSLAEEDGKISQDEADMLAKVMENINKYTNLLKHAEEDGNITAAEKFVLTNTRYKLLAEAEKVARADNEITDEEQALLQKLAQLVSEQE